MEPWEVPWLTQLGACLRGLRTQSGLSQARLAARAELTERSLRRIEHGQRRTRPSTLERLVEALATGPAWCGGTGGVMAPLLEAAGPGLAEESAYRWRVEARRRRRETRRGRQAVTEHTIAYTYLLGGAVVEHHRHRRWVTRKT
ncbi:MAG: helix-turn-helix transcriptional regulator, partial [Nocardioidaceae bacterium]|nr:helix-turn-helix transcriptional regulator [Nocardioidaceae bacterium]